MVIEIFHEEYIYVGVVVKQNGAYSDAQRTL